MTTNDKNRMGERVGTLTVIAFAGWKPFGKGKRVRLWRFRCDCGHELTSPFHVVQMGSRICRECRKPNVEDLSNWKHGKLHVVAYDGSRKGHTYWLVRCKECQEERSIMSASLKQRKTPCFCVKNAERHGKTRTSTYAIWNAMIQRCTNPKAISFPNYGGRGVSVCARWMKFDNFYADMGERPEGLMLDRIDNEKPYSPKNCRWVTRTQQNRNTRRTIRITWNGETLPLQEWSDRLGWSRNVLHNRYHRGWSVEKMMTTPPRPPRKR